MFMSLYFCFKFYTMFGNFEKNGMEHNVFSLVCLGVYKRRNGKERNI